MAIRTEPEYEAMYRAHYSDVLRFVARRADPAHVDEIVGDTFWTAWKARARLPEDVRPWLFTTARNTMLNAGRGLRRRQALMVRIAAAPVSGADEVTDPGGLVAARVDLASAWQRLTPQDQEALALVVWDGLTDTQAASVLGCSAPAYRMRLARARARLRELLQQPEPGLPPARSTAHLPSTSAVTPRERSPR
ncbi:RNA polymerase sigma factor [Streptacidiphilus melanogenes]|uniref:RNA polymerase sigma factor n=1 Tax=Streptacidiphilus melanogenes TaxID=411235 RepID=UPI0005A968BE|nr:sigma-70 family RNA polymerase sigma factor [Streptacidiphilus melanogenes]